MQKLIVWALVALLVFVPTAPAFAMEQATRGRAFFKPGTDLSTPEKYAQEIEKCATDNTAARLSCDMLVASFNAAFADIDDVRDYRELAEYFRTETEVRPCPRVVTAVAHVIGDKVGYAERELRENCFFDTNAQRFVSSAGCGQWTPNLPARMRTEDFKLLGQETPQPAPAPSTPSSLGRDRNEGLILPPPAPQPRSRQDESSFLGRHKGKLITAGAAAGGLALLALLFRGSQRVEQRTDVCVGPQCR